MKLFARCLSDTCDRGGKNSKMGQWALNSRVAAVSLNP